MCWIERHYGQAVTIGLSRWVHLQAAMIQRYTKVNHDWTLLAFSGDTESLLVVNNGK